MIPFNYSCDQAFGEKVAHGLKGNTTISCRLCFKQVIVSFGKCEIGEWAHFLCRGLQ